MSNKKKTTIVCVGVGIGVQSCSGDSVVVNRFGGSGFTSTIIKNGASTDKNETVCISQKVGKNARVNIHNGRVYVNEKLVGDSSSDNNVVVLTPDDDDVKADK